MTWCTCLTSDDKGKLPRLSDHCDKSVRFFLIHWPSLMYWNCYLHQSEEYFHYLSLTGALHATMVPTRRTKPIASWSMYEALHDEVSELLVDADLHLEFHADDGDTGYTRVHDTNIMGRFVCHNRACRAKGWSSKHIAVRIRLYPGQKYNARVYHQRCKFCNRLSRPLLDQSYSERIAYWIKQWNGIRVERPPVSNDNRGPHNRELCEGCRVGHCSQSREDWITQLEGFVSLQASNINCIDICSDWLSNQPESQVWWKTEKLSISDSPWGTTARYEIY